MFIKQLNNNTRCFALSFLGSMFIAIGCLIYIFDPLNIIIQGLFELKPDTLLYKLWLNPPYVPLVKFYVFNVTNEEAFLNGKEKLKFNEVGPFTYRLSLRQDNPKFNDDGTLTYFPKRNFTFVREHSIGDPNNYIFRGPNYMLLALSQFFQEETMLSGWIVDSLCGVGSCSAFENYTVQYLLRDQKIGIPASDFLLKFLPEAQFGLEYPVISKFNKIDNDPLNEVTIMVDKSKYVSKSKLLTKDEKNTLYHIVKFNGKTEYNEFEGSDMKCRIVEGSFDTFLFPPDLNRNRSVRIFHPAICESLLAKPEGLHKTKNGNEGYRYVLDEKYLNPPKENPTSDTCCYKSGCQRKGLKMLSPCYIGLPFSLSKPHFYSGDPWLVEQINGMNPNKEDHDTSAFFHPTLMVPIEVRVRLQLNFNVGKTKNVKPFTRLSNLVLPLAWADLEIDELPSILNILELIFYRILPKIQTVLIYGFLGLGFILVYMFLVPSLLPNYNFLGHCNTRKLQNIYYRSINSKG